MNQSKAYHLKLLLDSCKEGNRRSQKELYRQFYSYAMNIALHYSKNQEEAQEILNDAFFKVFKKLHQFDNIVSFKGWLRRILINTAIDYFRKYHKESHQLEVIHLQPQQIENQALTKLSLDEVMAAIQQLSPAYRIVINLYLIEGLTHPEIAQRLGISVGTSKSNLAKARKKLQNMLRQLDPQYYKAQGYDSR